MPQGTMIGTATRDITPPVGEPLSGYIHREPPSLAILDPLSLQAMAIEAGDVSAIVLVTDLVGADGPATDSLRAAVSEATGVPCQYVVWHSVHTHASPSFRTYRGMARATDAYLAQVTAAAVSAATEALTTAAPVAARWSTVELTDLSYNRRRPDGAVDPLATVVLFEDAQGRPTRLVHWQCHPVCLGSDNRSISGDYVGAFRREVLRRSGGSVLYLNGCCGDLNPVHRGAEGRLVTGATLASATLECPCEEPLVLGPVRVGRRDVVFPLKREVCLEDVRGYIRSERGRLEGLQDALARRECAAMVGWAQDLLAALETGRLPDDEIGEVVGMRLGDLALLFLPCEALCAVGLALRARSPLAVTMPVGCTGNVVGYLGLPDEFAWGGYELDVAARYYGLLPFLPEAGQALLEAALEVLQDISVCAPVSSSPM